MRKLKFGTMVEITVKQNRPHFCDIPVGTKATVIKTVALPAYNLLVALDYKPLVVKEIEEQGEFLVTSESEQEYYTGYLERGSWKIK